jgi:hypothetical protein
LYVELSCFLFLFCSWNHHRLIGTIYLEKDCHLFSAAVFPMAFILEPLILVVRIFIVNEVVQDMAGIGHLEILA